VISAKLTRNAEKRRHGGFRDKAWWRESEKNTAHLSHASLSTRACNCLYNAGFSTVQEVRAATDADLLSIPNLGRGTVREIRQEIGPYDR
jgi:DNA-directed RNA polymerase alpha subunit